MLAEPIDDEMLWGEPARVEVEPQQVKNCPYYNKQCAFWDNECRADICPYQATDEVINSFCD